MKTTGINTKNLAIALAIILLLVSGYFILHSIRLSGKLKTERLDKESILSEKIELTNGMAKLRGELDAAANASAELNQILEATRDRVDEKQAELNRLNQKLASLQPYKAMSSDLMEKNKELEQQVREWTVKSASLEEEREGLKNQLSDADEARKGLENKLSDLLNKPFADNYRTEAQKGRQNRLTVLARRTNRLDISMDIPGNLQAPLNFTITTPDGVVLSSATDIASLVSILETDAPLATGKSGLSTAGKAMRRVEFVYTPEEKLKKGIYKYQIFSGSELLGHVQVRLK